VIAPAHIEKGIVAMRTPTFDFSRNYCDWCQESNEGQPLCVSVCPTLALELLPEATPENTILGMAVLNKDWCLAYKLIGCRYCYDACPYEAMGLDDSGRPYVIEDKCNGCGACESVCVSLKNASIASGATERAIIIRPFDAPQGR
jgi:ferredoxin-type protein NapG